MFARLGVGNGLACHGDQLIDENMAFYTQQCPVIGHTTI